MELETTLKSQTPQNRIRELGINPHYWYPVAWTTDFAPNAVVPVTVWQQKIALFRDADGNVRALEDACPHKGVELHRGDVVDNALVCPYHGWEFDGDGNCINIPYFPRDRKLPCASATSYPVSERYGIIWIFPGDPQLAEAQPLPNIPEYDDPQFFCIRIPGEFRAHYSICNENTMDVFHGYLHRHLQGWFDPILLSLQKTERDVKADYRVSYKGLLNRLLGLGKNKQSGTITRTVSVHYSYPHYHSSLEGVSSLYLHRLPVGPDLTRSFSLLFLPLRAPSFLRHGRLNLYLEKLLLNHVYLRFLNQDVEMIESEQRTYAANPNRRYVEVNPAIIALQKVILQQYAIASERSPAPDAPPTPAVSLAD